MNRSVLALTFVVLVLTGAKSASCQSTLLRDVETSNQFDVGGNLSQVTTTTGDGYADSYAINYQYNPSLWLMALPQQFQVTSSTPGMQSTTRTIQFVTDQNTGAVLYISVEPNGNESVLNLTRYLVDSHGVATGVDSSDASGRQHRGFSCQFDPSEDIFPILQTNALGQTESLMVYPAFGELAATVDANGSIQQWQYDGFGRLKAITSPVGANLSIGYAGPGLDVTVQYANGRTSDILYDPYLYEVQQDSSGFDGQTIVRLASYNGQNLLSEQDGPCFYGTPNCTATVATQYTYDEIGRLIGVLGPDGNGPHLTYAGLKASLYDASGNQRYVLHDQAGHVIKSSAINAGREISTTFTYEPFDLLKTIVDTYGNTTTFTHDIRGRTTIIKDPDSGMLSYNWDAFDQIHDEQNSNALDVTYKRDALGRIQMISTNEDSRVATYQWDTAPNGVGKLASATSMDAITTSYSYNPLSQLAGVSWNVSGANYGFSFSYDPIGRISTINYPTSSQQANFSVRSNYNQLGFLYQLLDGSSQSPYWQIDSENERGQVTAEHFANGVSTQRAFDFKGRATSTKTTRQNLTIQNLTYSYYPNSSLKERSNDFSLFGRSFALDELFKFDPLDRLQNVHSIGFLVPPPPSIPNIFDETFVYDDIGNVTQKTINTGSGTSLSLQYGQNGAGPHAITTINQDTYKYDPAGNQTLWSQASGLTRSVLYNRANLPVSITSTGGANPHPASWAFSYDSDGHRVLKTSPNGDTSTRIGGLYEHKAQQGQITDVYYLPDPEGAIAGEVLLTSAPASNNTYFFNADSLGSIQAVTDTSGRVQEQLWYESFGQLVAPNVPGTATTPILSSVTNGFTGHDEDYDLDLIDMVGRVYDPNSLHFLTPDPLIQNLARDGTLNRYAYAWSNPFKWVDPSGYQNEVLSGFDCADSITNDVNGIPDAGTSGGFVACVGGGFDEETGEPERSVSSNEFSVNPTGLEYTAGSVSYAGKSVSTRDYDELERIGHWNKSETGAYEVSVMKLALGLKAPALDVAEFKWISATSTSGIVLGDWLMGTTLETKVTGPAASLSAGFDDWTMKAVVGASLASASGSVGANFLGANISASGEARLGVKLGLEAGAEEFAIHAGLLSGALSMGAAKTGESESGWGNALTRLAPLVEQGAALSTWRGPGPLPFSQSVTDIAGFFDVTNSADQSVQSETSSDNGLFLFQQFQGWAPF